MSYVDYLKKQRNKFTGAWLEFCHALAANRKVFIFGEGHDEASFYLCEIRRHVSTADLKFIRCQGKENVLRLCPVVLRRVNRSQAIFIVDRDLDDLTGMATPNTNQALVFRTAGYSVENYLANEESVSSAWIDILRGSSDENVVNDVMQAYRSARRSFRTAALTIMAWILFHRHRGRRPNMNSASFSSLVTFSAGTVKRRRPTAAILDRVGGVSTQPSGSWKPISEARRVIRANGGETRIRGKYEAWFHAAFFRWITQEITQKHGQAALGSGGLQITEDNYVRLLAGKSAPPADFANFLSEWCQLRASSVAHEQSIRV